MSSCQDQPLSLNLLQNNSFELQILNSPDINFFVTSAEIPGISVLTASQSTRYNQITYPGEEIIYQDLTVRFSVDENLKNFAHIHNWIRTSGNPVSLEELYEEETRISASDTKFLGTAELGSIFSDIIIHITTSGGKRKHYAKFYDCFPTSLSSIMFSVDVTKPEPVTSTCTFKYTYYDLVIIP